MSCVLCDCLRFKENDQLYKNIECGHLFHYDCLYNLIRISKKFKCIRCKEPIDIFTFLTIYYDFKNIVIKINTYTNPIVNLNNYIKTYETFKYYLNNNEYVYNLDTLNTSNNYSTLTYNNKPILFFIKHIKLHKIQTRFKLSFNPAEIYYSSLQCIVSLLNKVLSNLNTNPFSLLGGYHDYTYSNVYTKFNIYDNNTIITNDIFERYGNIIFNISFSNKTTNFMFYKINVVNVCLESDTESD